MKTFRTALSGLMLSGLLVAAAPAMAEGKGDRADKAIAEAQGKVDIAAKLPAAGEVPHLQTDASAALRESREARSSGHKERAINLAMKASELADRAVAASQRADAAQANARSADVAAAQQDAANANARAASAEASANAAAADAAAARAAPPVVAVAQPASVTTETTKSTHVVPATKRKVIVQKARPAHAVTTEKTTTTVAN